MATIGKIDPFDVNIERWVDYIERLEQFFLVNEVKEEKQVPALLSLIGGKTYALLKSLVAPDKPSSKSFADLSTILKNHYSPKTIVIAERFKFYKRDQKEGETVQQYIAELKKLSESCKFAQFLTEALRDRLVCGLSNIMIQQKLLSEETLTYETAVNIATAMETAARDVKLLHMDSMYKSNKTRWDMPDSEVHKLSFPPNKFRSYSDQKPPTSGGVCYRCRGQHRSDKCPFKESECHFCQKKGHIFRACRNRQAGTYDETISNKNKNRAMKKSDPSKTHHIDVTEDEYSDDVDVYTIYHVTSKGKIMPYFVQLIVQGQNTTLEIDTGAAVTVVNEPTYHQWHVKCNTPLQPTSTKLKSYSGEIIPVLGSVQVLVEYETQKIHLNAIIVQGNGPCLMGRDWLAKIKLDWPNIFYTYAVRECPIALDELVSAHGNVFKKELGTLKGVVASIEVHPDAKPIYCKARPVPYALRSKIDIELDRQIESQVMYPVTHSEWAAPIVPVLKPDGTVRICGDFKTTVNRVAMLEKYPIPKTEDLLATMGGGEKFTKLDLSHAYQQILLDDQSQKYVTINTHRGLFRYRRLPFGVASAPGIFQRALENILKGIPFVIVRLDDILISGKTDSEHIDNLKVVLQRLDDAGVRLNIRKCVFMAGEVEYCGRLITAAGSKPKEDNVRAIVKAPVPKNVHELKAYLGMINFYHTDIKGLAHLLEPLHQLLRANSKWKWEISQQQAFEKSKELLISADLLVHYSSDKELILDCDASPYGVGAVISHPGEDGRLHPIAYASRTLAAAERNYSQIDKEALAILFGVKKFHQYVYGRHFVINTDHKPLLGLLGEAKPIPKQASPRMLRWAITLSGYDYNLRYRKGCLHSNADGLSRLPLSDKPDYVPDTPETVFLLEFMDGTPVTSKEIRAETKRDRVLGQVITMIQNGWPETCPNDEFKPYFHRKAELSVVDGCVIWGQRVVIPKTLTSKIIDELHQMHPGICRMKALARSYVWWPGIDMQLENKVRTCGACQTNRKMPEKAPLHPWEYPSGPWKRLHIDYAGPYRNKMFLIITDAYSKWMEVHIQNSCTTAATIISLTKTFATYGLPEQIVSDNATYFSSAEFEEFIKMNGIHHIRVSPYHAASNGQAERYVQTFKEAMEKLQPNGQSLETQVAKFLMRYRVTPHSTTGISPSQLLMNRQIRTRLDLVRPEVSTRVQRKQSYDKYRHDLHAKERVFVIGDEVYLTQYGAGSSWIPGTVVAKIGPVSYAVELNDGRLIRRHQDHLRKRFSQNCPPIDPEEGQSMNPSAGTVSSHESQSKHSPNDIGDESSIAGDISDEPAIAENHGETNHELTHQTMPGTDIYENGSVQNTQPGRATMVDAGGDQRYPTRLRMPPKYLEDYKQY